MLKKFLLSALFSLILIPHFSFAQEAILITDTETFEKAKVLQILKQGTTTVAGTDTVGQTQTIQIEIVSGKDRGKTVIFKNDYVQLKVGDIFYVRHLSNHLDSSDYWSVADPYRLDILLWLAIAFVALIFIFGGIQGVRGLASLIGSLFLIFYLLIPGIYDGYNAILVSTCVSSLIIIVGSYITHGFNRTTTSAVIGMIVTVILTGLAAYYVVYAGKLSGYSLEEATYLTLDTRGAISMVGLLFGGIMIGLLGVLYDIAIGQAVAVEELFRAGKQMTRKEVYMRGIRIGREHIGALVNTLAIAYVGASLPLLLLIQSSTVDFLFILNSEVFATEVVRILIGSIGLILAVPITTLIASYMLEGKMLESTKRNHGHSH
jgi:uncharacterized membrane protein